MLVDGTEISDISGSGRQLRWVRYGSLFCGAMISVLYSQCRVGFDSRRGTIFH